MLLLWCAGAVLAALALLVTFHGETRRVCIACGQLLSILLAARAFAATAAKRGWNFTEAFRERVEKTPDSVALIAVDGDVRVTWRELDERSNRFAHFVLSRGLRQQDAVALVCSNCVDFVAFWIGVAKAGGATALLNTHISGKPLVHALNVAVENNSREGGCKMAFVSRDVAEHIVRDDVLQHLAEDVQICVYDTDRMDAVFTGRDPGAPPTPCAELDSCTDSRVMEVTDEISALPVTPVARAHCQGLNSNSSLMFIYTSGTTGLPKASRITHQRFFISGLPSGTLAGLSQRDVMYCPLPLYHSSGGMMTVSAAIRTGCTFVMRKKFSVSRFAKDCFTYKCTALQYIGELCRYLANSPATEYDDKLSLRVAVGNGLRPDVWTRFTSRYNIKQICEFYGSTEGNVFICNSVNKVGALGLVPTLLRFIYPIKLARVDENQELVRDANGFCVEADAGEPGHLLGRIRGGNAEGKFEGYTDKKATEKKILRDLFVKGDSYFATGDLLKRDSFGFYYWVDRIGDTFRWKGENVATTEVQHALADCPGFADVTVYGVSVPGQDGRAGMASVTLHESATAEELDWSAIGNVIDEQLPAYARPLFFRIQQAALETTATFKHRKVELVEEGFDPERIPADHRLFFRDPKTGTVAPLDAALFDRFTRQEVRI